MPGYCGLIETPRFEGRGVSLCQSEELEPESEPAEVSKLAALPQPVPPHGPVVDRSLGRGGRLRRFS